MTTTSRSAGRPADTNPAKTRAALMEAAIHRFARQGLARTTLREIAETAGLSSGTLYHHFNSKADLYRAAYLWAVEGQVEAYRQAASRTASVRSRVVAILDSAHERLMTHPDISMFILRAWVEHNAEDQEPLPVPESVVAFYELLMRDGIEAGELSEDTGPELVDAVRAMLWGIQALAMTGRTPSGGVEGLKRLVRDPLSHT